MFKIKCDDKYIYNPKSKKHLVENPQLTEELNKSGKLTFNVPPTNANILNLNGLISKVELYNDKELEFAGRVIETKDNFHNQKNVTVEGELSYLCDSIQRLKVYKCTPYDFFHQVIEEHNKQVTEDKQFKVGMFTIKDANDFIYRYTNYENTLAVLNDKLISSLGGYLRVRHVNGTRYLDLIESYNNTNTQVIEFKKNLLDFNKYIKLSEIRTAMIPLGYETDKTVTIEGETGTIKERLTILDYPDGEYGDIVKKGDIIYSKTGVAKYGYIYADKKDSTWNDVTVVDNLFNKSVNTLKKLINVTVTIELNAIDLHLIDVDIEKIKLGDMIRVVSKPHGLDSYFLVTKILKNLQNPQNNKITLGDSLGSFTESINRATNANNTTVEEIKHTTVNAVEEAKKTATDLLKDVTTGDIRFIDGSLYILDNPDIKKAKQVWRWNKNGWGYSSTGIDGEYGLAATMDGGIVADFITTGVLKSLQIINGDNFKVDEQGIMKALAGEIGGWILNSLYLYANYIIGEKKYQCGLYSGVTNGNDVFLYAGAPLKDNGTYEEIKKWNTYITKNGLINAKWFRVNGENGFFYIDFNSGRRALDLYSNGIAWYLDDDTNNKWFSIYRNGNGQWFDLRDAPFMGLWDSLHQKNIATFYRLDPNSEYRAKNTAVIDSYADIIAQGTREDGVNHSFFINSGGKLYEVATNAVSDKRLKKRIKKSTESALDIIKKIKICKFEWKKPRNHKRKCVNFGYIAQQVQEVLKSLVIHDTKEDTYQMDILGLSALNTKGIQEIDDKYSKKITELENKISKLEGGNK